MEQLMRDVQEAGMIASETRRKIDLASMESSGARQAVA